MKIVALAGGVGGAKLVVGLAKILQPQDLTVIVNTGDDFTHFGLRICPDLDTICYSLAGIANIETGWGLQVDTWQALTVVKKLGGPTWFKLGDEDLGIHLYRTSQLSSGIPLSKITLNICQSLGIKIHVIPMTDNIVSTWIMTEEDGLIPFQEYFVHQQCKPRVKGFTYLGSDSSRPTVGVLEALKMADFIVLCPSNPWVSIIPILSVPGIKESLAKHPVVAVSPIIGGKAIKGPTAKMYLELGIEPSPDAVAENYKEFLTGLIIDEVDHNQVDQISDRGIISYVTNTLMVNDEDRQRLAGEVLSFGKMLSWR